MACSNYGFGRWRNGFHIPGGTAGMVDLIPSDPVIIAMVLVLLSLIFFLYLLLRRTVLEFRKGMDR